MPILEAKLPLYPGGSTTSAEWLEIRARIRERAGDRCECCGLENGAIGARLPDGGFLELDGWRPGDVLEVAAIDLDGDWRELELKVFRLVCTLAHVDGELVDHSDGNLRFWCQQCHNRHDARRRAAQAAATRQARRPRDLFTALVAP